MKRLFLHDDTTLTTTFFSRDGATTATFLIQKKMSHVLSLGGVFLRCRDHQKMRDWYAEMLEIKIEPWGGAQFFYKNDLATDPEAYNNLSFFKADTDYLAPSESGFMLNFRVRDLDGLVEKMRQKGATLVGDPQDSEYGKFAWALDPDGNKIELWQPPTNAD